MQEKCKNHAREMQDKCNRNARCKNNARTMQENMQEQPK